jgi:Kef-type K+ transport system membrane component KefB
MKKVALYSILLLLGLVGSQLLPGVVGESWGRLNGAITALTTVALAFIMIHVGYEFEIDKTNPRAYAWDYVVAMTAAAFPWVFVTLYLVLAVLPGGSVTDWEAWKESLLAGRFAAPTSAGVLFSMLAAAGLSATWLFRKARVLAIFDDLDTVLLMIPLKMLIVGLAWQLGVVVLIMAAMLWLAWRYLHRWTVPSSWPWVLGYAGVIVFVCELVHFGSKQIDPRVPIHLEVLLPAFVLGCVMKRPAGTNPHSDDAREGHQEGPESETEQRVATIISAAFMVLVGLTMPAILGQPAPAAAIAEADARLSASQAMPSWGVIALHVGVVTVLANLGKMFAAFCYRREAHWRERLAVAIGMWPRGEVGAGVLVISISYGIGGPVLTVAMLSLALNLALTGVFIAMVKRLAVIPPAAPTAAQPNLA